MKEKVLGAVRAGITRIVRFEKKRAGFRTARRGAQDHRGPPPESGRGTGPDLRGATFKEGRLLFGEENPRDVTPLAQFHH